MACAPFEGDVAFFENLTIERLCISLEKNSARRYAYAETTHQMIWCSLQAWWSLLEMRDLLCRCSPEGTHRRTESLQTRCQSDVHSAA